MRCEARAEVPGEAGRHMVGTLQVLYASSTLEDADKPPLSQIPPIGYFSSKILQTKHAATRSSCATKICTEQDFTCRSATIPDAQVADAGSADAGKKTY